MDHARDALEHFPAALANVLGIEADGNDPRDRGGATRFGISLAFARQLAAREARWMKILDRDGDGAVTEADVRALPPEVCQTIYAVEFWLRYRCHELPHPAGGMWLSYLVNMDPHSAGRVLQEAINRALTGREDRPLVRDGIVGEKTLAAAARCDVAELCKRLEAAASELYAKLAAAQPHFGDGWQYRSADALWWAALQWARTSGQ